MKIKPIYWIALALAIAFGIAVCDGLRIRDKYSISIGNYQAALDQSKKDGTVLTLQIDRMTAIVGQKDKEIAEKNETIGHMTNTIGQQDADLETLGQKLHQLETSGDLSAQVANLKEQIKIWSEKFSLSEAIIAEKDKVIEAWAAKYTVQVTISESFKQKYENELRLRSLAEKGWKASENRLRWTRVMGNIKSGLILAAAGYIGLNMIKGK
jgi:chromosome segregation ATPase